LQQGRGVPIEALLLLLLLLLLAVCAALVVVRVRGRAANGRELTRDEPAGLRGDHQRGTDSPLPERQAL
jgi:hypothetical protein